MLATVIESLGAIADRAGDSDERRLRYRILIYAGSLMSIGGVLWGGIAFANGLFYESFVPFGYTLLTIANFSILYFTRNFAVARTFQILISLLLPFGLQWVLGGFIHSGTVMIWSVISFVGALALENSKKAVLWLLAFVILVIVSGLLEPYLMPPEALENSELNILFLVINVIAVCSFLFFLLLYFAEGRRKAILELDVKNKELMDSRQALVQSEKLAALGQLVAGVAHELNTPLGTIRAATRNLDSIVVEAAERIPSLLLGMPSEELNTLMTILEVALESEPCESSREERELRKSLNAVLLGKGFEQEIAHQISSCFSEIGIKTIETKWLPALRSEKWQEGIEFVNAANILRRNSATIDLASQKAGKIVFALKNYAYPGAAGEVTSTSISDQIATVLTVYHNQLKHGINTKVDIETGLEVEGLADQLTQVWGNLVVNGMQAMNFKGTLDIVAKAVGDKVVVAITDDGPGISEDVQHRLFEPFFTTKEMGEGTGLGLSICKDIIQRHGGEILVDSEPGRTTFTVSIPQNGGYVSE